MGGFAAGVLKAFKAGGQFLGNGIVNGFPGSERWANVQRARQGQQQLDIEQQQEQIRQQQEADRQRQADFDFHQALQNAGARPIINGVVKETGTLPSSLGLPGPNGEPGQPVEGQQFDIVRPADKSRRIAFKDHTGDQVEYELPTPEEQIQLQLKRGAPERQTAVQQAKDIAAAQGAGKFAAEDQAATVQFTPEQEKQFNLAPGQKYTRDQSIQIAEKYDPVLAGQLRAQAQADLQAKRDQARLQRQREQQSFNDQQNLRKLAAEDSWNIQRRAVESGYAPNLAPVKLRAFDRAKQQWDSLQSQADDLQGQVHQAQLALDPQITPDGEAITNPFTGGQMVMSSGVRQMLQLRAQTAQKSADTLRKQAGQLEQTNSVSMQAPAAQPQGTGGGSPAANGMSKAMEDRVKAIAEGREPAPSGRAAMSGPGLALMNRVYQYDPGFSTQRAQVRKAFTTGNDGRNIGALNTATVHLDQLMDAADAMQNGSFRPGNSVFNSIKTMFGDAAPTNFEGVKAAVAGEMASALKGNATDAEIATMKATIDRSSSPQQLRGAVETGLHVLGAKLNTYHERYQQQIPDDTNWSPVMPSAKAVFQKHGIDPTRGPVNVGTSGTSQYKAGDTRTINGVKYIRDDKGTWNPQK